MVWLLNIGFGVTDYNNCVVLKIISGIFEFPLNRYVDEQWLVIIIIMNIVWRHLAIHLSVVITTRIYRDKPIPRDNFCYYCCFYPFCSRCCCSSLYYCCNFHDDNNLISVRAPDVVLSSETSTFVRWPHAFVVHTARFVPPCSTVSPRIAVYDGWVKRWRLLLRSIEIHHFSSTRSVYSFVRRVPGFKYIARGLCGRLTKRKLILHVRNETTPYWFRIIRCSRVSWPKYPFRLPTYLDNRTLAL